MLPAVSPTLPMIGGAPFGVHRGRSRTALHFCDRCGSVPFLAILCGFISPALPCRRYRVGKYFQWPSFSVPVSRAPRVVPACRIAMPPCGVCIPQALSRYLLRHQFSSSSICNECETLEPRLAHSCQSLSRFL